MIEFSRPVDGPTVVDELSNAEIVTPMTLTQDCSTGDMVYIT